MRIILSQHAIFSAQIEDVKAAVRWLRSNAETYRLDPKSLRGVGFICWWTLGCYARHGR